MLGVVAMSAPAPDAAKPPSVPAVTRPLTAGQEKIVGQIRTLHAARQPLNITAVKRRHPGLMKSVYAIKPYWGWKQALADAGVTYDDINTELLDYCRCQICGREFGSLGYHLGHAHETTPEEYLEEFPGAELASEQSRAAHQNRRRLIAPDWEPLWSWEYVCDRAMDFHRRGWAMNVSAIHGNEPALLGFVGRRGRQWDDVLRAIGLDPLEVRLYAVAEHLTKSDVIKRLQQRRREGRSLAVERLSQEDLSLESAARRLFGNHDEALRAARIDPAQVRLHRPARTSDDERELEAALRRLATLSGDDRWVEARRIKAKWAGLVFPRLGTWRRLCERLGVPYEVLVTKPRYRTVEEVLAGLHQHWQAGLSLSEINRQAKGLNLQARRLCGSWPQAVVLAARKYGGFDLTKVTKSRNAGFYRANA